MKNIVSMIALAAILFTANGFAQEKPTQKKKATPTKTCSAEEMKACKKDKKTCTAEDKKTYSKDKKAGCCAAKAK
jgi:predicted outer membrane protein